MDLKMAVLMILGFLVLGILISLMFGSIVNLSAFAPSTEDVLINDLMTICNGKILIYNQVSNELNKKNFCCASTDINQNGIIESGEYCATLHNQGTNICMQPINYYTTYEMC